MIKTVNGSGRRRAQQVSLQLDLAGMHRGEQQGFVHSFEGGFQTGGILEIALEVFHAFRQHRFSRALVPHQNAGVNVVLGDETADDSASDSTGSTRNQNHGIGLLVGQSLLNSLSVIFHSVSNPIAKKQSI